MPPFSTPALAIVDDNPVVRLFTSFLLISNGFEIAFEAENGQDSIEKMSAGDRLPDLVLMDLDMPVMDGYETIGIIKATWPDVKIVVLTDKDDQASFERVLAAGADHFLSKQVNLKVHLIDVIEGVMARSSAS